MIHLDAPHGMLRWKRHALRASVVLVLAAVGIAAGMLVCGITSSVQAEQNLHATIFAIRLVEQFVADQGRWPRSWDELERISMPKDVYRYDWPKASAEIQRRVSIDFRADVHEIAGQDPMNFTAIWPIGPYCEFRDYGFVPSLQASIRKAVTEKRAGHG